VVIVQMRDREGFAELQRNLRSYDIPYVIEEIPAELYELAQGISCYTGHNPTSCVRNVRASAAAATTAESSDACNKTFVFSKALLETVPGASDSVKDAQGGTLLHTAKENFVILSIGTTSL
jgi:hypothetical protein